MSALTKGCYEVPHRIVATIVSIKDATLLVASASPPFMYCDAPAHVTSIRKPVSAAHVGAGSVTLANGASFEISQGDDFIVHLRIKDNVQVCYAPPQHWADEGPTARMAIAGNVRTGDYLYTVAYPAPRPKHA